MNNSFKLNNGVEIPKLGLGVFQIEADQTAEVVKNAIINGYRLIDTAAIYGNEKETGEGIRAGLEATGLKREDIFVTSKVWNDHLTYDQATAAYNDSLAKLGLDYLDLYLIHWPGNKAYKEAYQALEDLYKAKKIRAIGVSNFEIHHLEDLLSYATVKPVMNQIELHPMLDQHEVRAFMDANDIATQAWSPLMQGQILDNAVITAIAAKHGKSAAQVTLRWEFQQGILFNVKSVKVERMIANKDIFDFELSAEEMSEINALNQNLRVGPNPDEFDFVM